MQKKYLISVALIMLFLGVALLIYALASQQALNADTAATVPT